MACDEGNSSPWRTVCGCRPDSIVLPLGSFLGPPRGNPGSEVKEIEEYYSADCFEGYLAVYSFGGFTPLRPGKV